MTPFCAILRLGGREEEIWHENQWEERGNKKKKRKEEEEEEGVAAT